MKIRSRETILETPWIRVCSKDVEGMDGAYYTVEVPDYVCVIATTPDVIACERQPVSRLVASANSRTVSAMTSATGRTDSIRPATWPESAMAAFMSPPK